MMLTVRSEEIFLQAEFDVTFGFCDVIIGNRRVAIFCPWSMIKESNNWKVNVEPKSEAQGVVYCRIYGVGASDLGGGDRT